MSVSSRKGVLKLRVFVLALLAAGATAGLASADGIDPHDFDVRMTNAPKIGIKGSGDLVMPGVTMSGTVKERSGGHSGTMTQTCDIELHTKVEDGNLTADGAQRCSWFMDFGSGSTLAGTLAGGNHVTMTPDGGTMTGSMTVTVVAGTGDFAGRVGGGTFTQNSTLPAPPKPPLPPGGCTLPPGTPAPKPGDPPPPGCSSTPGTPAPGQPAPTPPGGCTLPPGTPLPAPGTPPPPGCSPTPGTPPGGTPTPPPGSPTTPPPGCPTPAPGTTPEPCLGPAVPVDPAHPPCPPPGVTPPPGTPVPADCPKAQTIMRSLMSIVAGGSKMNLKLRKGEAGAEIAAPGPKVSKKSDGGLRVVAAPGSTCSAVASGPATVKLGSAKDTNRDGLVVVVKKLVPKLKAGQWSIVATCSAGGHTATAKSTVTVS